MESRDMPEASDPGLEPSPLMKWTSDGSMMEELLKSLNPGSQQPAPQGETALVKDTSISSTLLALIAQQEEENVAADREACTGYHQSQPETLLRKHNADGIKASIKSEERGWMPAPFVDGQLGHPENGEAVSSNGIVSGGHPDAALSMPASSMSTGTRSQEGVSFAILPSKLLTGQNTQGNHFSRPPSDCTMHESQKVAVQPASAQPPASDVQGRTTNSRSAVVEDMAAYTAGVLQQQSQRVSYANPVPRPRYLHGGQDGEQGIGYPSTSLPTRVHQGTFQELARNYGSASLPSANYQRSSVQQAHMQTSNGCIHVENTEEDLSSLNRQSDGHHQMLAFLGNMGRAASAPRERLRPDIREFPVQPRTPLEQGSELRTIYTQAGEIGSQLAAEYMREAEQTSRNSYTTPPTPGGLPHAQTATATLSAACLDGTNSHASSAPHFLAGCQQFHNDLCSGPPSVADLVAEPPAILTADLRSIAGRSPEHQAALSNPVMATSNATPNDRIASRAKRDRNFRAAKPPVGLKRPAVGPLPARAVSTDIDEETEEHSAEAETGPWEDTHMEDREAKKQLRKEKNRASAAASRARREAYTASLEEEVARLKEERSWLEGQVNAPGDAMPLSLATRAPVRHLSI
ncbi:hypothetical protein COCOBI_18-2730 [Coccomyxa sp. Obi]|nr:hypothetical protein COCOBI_18-2730 [Coccomyxa sp. Obi]